MAAESRIVVVTGGAGGLGRGTIRCLRDVGWTTVSVDIAQATSAPESERADLEIVADVSNETQVKSAFVRIQEELAAPDALVCLAGIVHDGSVVAISKGSMSHYPLEHWKQTLAVNLTGTFLAAQCFLAQAITHRRRGTIVTCSSPAADGAPGQCAYSASKAGVEAFTRALAREAAPWNVRVCGFRPALTHTPMAEKYSDFILEGLIKKSLIGRFALSREVARTVRFLLESELAQGTILDASGGIRL